jgi:N-methylhydantoinase A/oxoprolinase/acetone carboxylase beta subunit
MAVRIGVDVGGTFTKAVAFDLAAGRVVAQASLPTSHRDPDGPAAGVVAVVRQVADEVGPGNVELVTYSTTQAVNALLEGDVGAVGVLGMGAQPDLRKARKRTRLDKIELSPGRTLRTVSEFVDVTNGLEAADLDRVLSRFAAEGVTAMCAAEAFATEAATNERLAVAAAAGAGLPGCASSDMSGLYGLELRAVTAALNASILPIAVRTAGYVLAGVAAAGVTAPVMVMRGDGGATDLDGFRRAPARTLYSGPAASVAGVLRFGRMTDGVVVEVGGTSTNVAAVKAGKPALSYVQVASHATALRAIDVRVVGVAGGSVLRARKGRLYGVGPRSAHIAGLPYCCFLPEAEVAGARAELVAPLPEDPVEYVVLRLADGRRAAVTNTCAAVALEVVEAGDYAAGDRGAATAGLDAAGALLRLPGTEVARRMLDASGSVVADLVRAVAADHELTDPAVVAVGGGAGGLGRYAARMLGLACTVPDHAEVISSIGDALSLIRAEREWSVPAPTAADSAAVAAEAEEECLAAGAAPGSVDVRVEFDQDRSTLRAIATGAVGLGTGLVPGRPPVDAAEALALATAQGFDRVDPVGGYWLSSRPSGELIVLDRFGDVVVAGTGGTVIGDGGGANGAEGVRVLVDRLTRRLGPVSVAPNVWLVDGGRLLEVAAADTAALDHPDRTAGAVIVTRA